MGEQAAVRPPWGLSALLLAAFAAFAALGLWQVQRLHWKQNLIARVDARVHAAPVALPTAKRLNEASQADVEYLRVGISGTYLSGKSALVRAATDLGTGYWAMNPMRLGDGRTIWVNRGFVPAGTTADELDAAIPKGEREVTGLLRPSEPGGSLLQANHPDEGRWYSRDTQALSTRLGEPPSPPWFVDAQTESGSAVQPALQPVPGLTVIQFPNNHLGYALTWFALAVLSLVGIGLAWRRPIGD